MKFDPNEVRLVPLTNYEILMMIDMMRKFIPTKEDEQPVMRIVEKLQKTMT